MQGYKLKVEIKGIDFEGRAVTVESKHDSIETVAAYLKLINVPCLFDIGTRNPHPNNGKLNLNLVDDRTYNHVIRPDFLNKEIRKKNKIPLIKEAV